MGRGPRLDRGPGARALGPGWAGGPAGPGVGPDPGRTQAGLGPRAPMCPDVPRARAPGLGWPRARALGPGTGLGARGRGPGAVGPRPGAQGGARARDGPGPRPGNRARGPVTPAMACSWVWLSLVTNFESLFDVLQQFAMTVTNYFQS